MAVSQAVLAGLLALGAPGPVPVHHARQGIATDEGRTLHALELSIAESVSRYELPPSEFALVGRGLADGVLHRPAGLQPGQYGPMTDQLARARPDMAFQEEERTGAAVRAEALAAHSAPINTPCGAVAIPRQERTRAVPVPADTARVACTGRLTDKSVFDRTQPGESLTAEVSDAAMACLTAGSQRMRSGAARRLICRPERDSRSPGVRAGSTLIHDIEPLEVLEPAQGGLQ